MPKLTKVERPVKVTLSLTQDQASRFERLGFAMGQPITVAVGISATLGLNALEAMYGLKDMRGAVEAVMEPVATDTVLEMRQAGMPISGGPGK